jgi:hypothetical protein
VNDGFICFDENKVYEFMKLWGNAVSLKDNYGREIRLNEPDLLEFFYTDAEIRKIKIDNLLNKS